MNHVARGVVKRAAVLNLRNACPDPEVEPIAHSLWLLAQSLCTTDAHGDVGSDVAGAGSVAGSSSSDVGSDIGGDMSGNPGCDAADAGGESTCGSKGA